MSILLRRHNLIASTSSSHDYSKDYLTFTVIENSTFSFSVNNLQYSLDNGSTWTTLAAGSSTPTVNAGNKILWKRTGLRPTSSNGIGTFSATGNFEASGNIMSLYYGDNFTGQTDLTGKDYAFRKLFSSNTKLVNAENLILPATTLVNYCYYQMFSRCTSLTTAPELPATTLSSNCYYQTFFGCTSLTTAPELPATTLVSNCYYQMFSRCTSLTTAPELPATTLSSNCYYQTFFGCTSLTTAPELPATTLVSNCYYQMFNDCTSLNYIKCLATNISANYCTSSWVRNVSATGTFIKAANTTWQAGISGIPSGWTVVDEQGS